MRTTSGTPTRYIDREGKREGFPTEGWHYDALFAIMSTLFVGGIYLVGWTTTHSNTAPSVESPSYALPGWVRPARGIAAPVSIALSAPGGDLATLLAAGPIHFK